MDPRMIAIGLEIVDALITIITKLSAATGLSPEELAAKFSEERAKFEARPPENLPDV